jgi:simple sugar transport system permease protein
MNIGAEGQLLAGAAAAAAVGLTSAEWPRALVVPVTIASGAGAGAVWAGIAAWLRRRFGVLEVISTLMLNFVAISMISWLVRGPLQEPTGVYAQSATLAESARWPLLLPGHRLHLGFLLGVGAALAAWYALARTAAGFRVRVIGASARAAESASRIPVQRTVGTVFLLSGALAGVAGASEVGGVTWALYEGLSPGYGYTAIAVALLAQLDPRGVLVTAVFFGALDAGTAAMQREAGIPSVLGQVIAALVVLAVLVAQRGRATVAGVHG